MSSIKCVITEMLILFVGPGIRRVLHARVSENGTWTLDEIQKQTGK